MPKSKQESIIDELYENNYLNYEENIGKRDKKNKKKRPMSKLLNAMELCYLDDIPQKSKNIIRDCYDKIDIAWANELDFWQKEFYRIGFIDGMRMHEEIKENIKKLEKKV